MSRGPLRLPISQISSSLLTLSSLAHRPALRTLRSSWTAAAPTLGTSSWLSRTQSVSLPVSAKRILALVLKTVLCAEITNVLAVRTSISARRWTSRRAATPTFRFRSATLSSD